jgi:predicted alpha/beta-hydrolase family hydrolase
VTSDSSDALTIAVGDDCSVSALWLRPADARACFVFGHGAGAGMDHPSMATLATGLSELGVATLRYQFPYMERRSKRPDPPPLCHATVRAAIAEAARLAPELPRIAGGRSFGGRMTSQAHALEPLPGVRGLAFFAFPLHPAGRPSDERARHLSGVRVPMLFIQGTRDELASLELLEPLVATLGSRATLKLLREADHSFHVLARSGRNDAEVRAEALQAFIAWTASLDPAHNRAS